MWKGKTGTQHTDKTVERERERGGGQPMAPMLIVFVQQELNKDTYDDVTGFSE